MEKPQSPSHSNQESTHRLVHVSHVVQGLTDGYIAVIGHANQQDNLGSSKEMFNKNLSDAVTEGNGVLSRDQVKDQLGCCGGRVGTIYHGQIRQKNVHERTEGWAGKDGD